jgi:hypothetical protein
VTVTPGTATNVVGQPHTFTVHVNVIGPDSTTAAPDGTTVTWGFTPSGLGTVDTAATTCNAPGTAGGTCNIVFNNNTAGTGTLTVTAVTVVFNGEPHTEHFTAGGLIAPPAPATKTWNNFRVTVTPPTATNTVGEPHTFTVLVEKDTGSGFAPLPNAPVALSSAGTAVVNPPIPSSCTTDANGECRITTTSNAPGSLTLTATYEAASDSPAGPVAFTGSGDKQWVPGPPPPVTPPAVAPTPPAVVPPSHPGVLPFTGSAAGLIAFGAFLVLVGFLLTTVIRRRRAHRAI